MRVAMLSSILAVATLVLVTLGGAQDLSYRLRTNREEGLKDLQAAGGTGLRLLSFVAWREPTRLADRPVLRVRFFLAAPRRVFITAVELRRHGRSHYQMRPTRTRWPAGWQEFAPWPTADVLVPAKIDPASLGILARLDDDLGEGSGAIAPVILYTNQPPPAVSRYVAQFLPRNTLSKVDYTVANVETGFTVVDSRLCEDSPGSSKPCVAGNAPFQIVLDLGSQPSGTYRFVIDTREYGRASGPSHQYFFHHEGRS